MTSEDIGGLTQLPKNNTITFVTSSNKDVMVLKELGFPAICFNGESYGINKASKSYAVAKSVLDALKKRSKYLILFLDSDEPGLKATLGMAQAHKLMWVTTREGGPKDISDYYKKYGRKKTFRLVKKLIKKKVINNDEVPY